MARDTTTASAKSAAEPDHVKQLEAEIAALRKDLAAITETMGGIAKDTQNTASKEFQRAKEQAVNTAEEAKERLVAEYEHYEDELQGAIRERPISSVLIAAGVGFVLAKIL